MSRNFASDHVLRLPLGGGLVENSLNAASRLNPLNQRRDVEEHRKLDAVLPLPSGEGRGEGHVFRVFCGSPILHYAF